MPKNKSKARKQWRKDRVTMLQTPISSGERLLLAIFGDNRRISDSDKPGTEFGR